MTEPSRGVVLAETKYLRLVQDGHWTYAQRPHISGAIAIAAVTDEGDLLLVEQYRIPVQGPVIELPAGLVGDEAGQEAETWQQAAARELEEEAGYRAAGFALLTHAVSSAGLTDESVHLLQATGLQRVGAGGGVASEDIRVHHVPLAEVPGWLQRQQLGGRRVDYKVYAALFFLCSRCP